MKTPPTRQNAVATTDLFCLLVFVFFAASPVVEARPDGVGARGHVNFSYDLLHRVGNVGYRDLELVQIGGYVKQPLLGNLFVGYIRALDINPPLFDGELAGDVVDDFALFGAAGGSVTQPVEERGDNSPEGNSSRADKGGLNSGVERHSEVDIGMVLWLVGCFSFGLFFIGWPLGMLIGRWLAYAIPMGPVFPQNVKHIRDNG
jgi:hypothetical protein